MDGELDKPLVVDACRQWRADDELQDVWHAYHLIGDVLRSDDLACASARDVAFLDSIRQRLKDEPVVLAPQAEPAIAIEPKANHRSWAGMSAVAAGFVAVAGLVAVLQSSDRVPTSAQPGGTVVAAAPNAGASVVLASEGGASDPQHIIVNGQLIRDARLDEYLAAHKKFGGSSLPGGPSGVMRSAAVENSGR